jgi:carboxylesterase type B
VVFVMMNWRLNIFGFLSSGHEEIPGNMGLWDQHHVLRWIRQNIMNFGGHPGKVTIMGHGGGAWSAGYHVLSPVSQIMFKRSIMLSGSPYALITMMASKANNPTIFYKLCKKWDCPVDGTEKAPQFSKETFECVRNMDIGKLIEGIALHAQGQQDPGTYPTEDGEFFDMHPFESIEKGRFGQQTQVLIGNGQHEGALMAMLMLPEEYHPQVSRSYIKNHS